MLGGAGVRRTAQLRSIGSGVGVVGVTFGEVAPEAQATSNAAASTAGTAAMTSRPREWSARFIATHSPGAAKHPPHGHHEDAPNDNEPREEARLEYTLG